jgi:hypothetical protein
VITQLIAVRVGLVPQKPVNSDMFNGIREDTINLLPEAPKL